MNNQPNWDKAPEGYPIWIESKKPGERHDWHAEEDRCYRDPTGSYWPKGGEGIDYIVHRRPEWNGEGLPPAGIECELMVSVSPTVRYTRVKVIGHDEGLVVFRIAEGPDKGEYGADTQRQVLNHPAFRPCLTAEQIAAKQREEKVQAIVDDILGNTTGISPSEARVCAVALVDKGYEPPGGITS